MKLVDTFKRSSRSLRHAKLRTLLTATALAVGGFTLTLTLAAATGARQYANRLVSANFDSKAVFVAKDKDFFGGQGSSKPRLYSSDLTAGDRGALLKEFDTADIAKIKTLPHVTQVLENYTLNAQFITRQGAKAYTGAVNVYDPAQKPQIKVGQEPAILTDSQVLLPDDYLSLLNFASASDALGKTITIQVQQLSGQTLAKDFVVVGITTQSSLSLNFNTVGPYVAEDEAGQLNSFVNGGTVLANRVATITVRGDTSANILKAEMQGAGYEARTAQDLQAIITQVINVLQGIILIFGLITLIASFFGVVNTQYISVLERTREIGLMKALGMSRKTVSRLFMIEATWIGGIGALLGSLVAIGAGTTLNPWLSQKINFGSEHLLIFKPLEVVGLIVFLMIITTIAGLLPARKAAKLDPIEALRTE